MHPCQACGVAEVDAVGYCSNCRVYQGVASYEASTPAGAVYYQGAPGSPVAVGVATPEVVYASGYDAAVYHAPVEHAAAPEPDPAPAGSPTRARPAMLMPLFVVTVIMLLITSGTLVAFVVRSDALDGTKASVEPPAQNATPSAAPSTSAAPSAAAAPKLADDCLYGTWTVNSMKSLSVAEDENTLFSSTAPAGSIRFSPDGTGMWELGGLTLEHKPTKQKGVNTGTITFTVTSANQMLTFTTVKSNAQAALYKAGEDVGVRPIGPMYPALSYSCGGNALVMEGELVYFELRRS